MSINKTDVARLALLTKIALSDEELDKLTIDVGDILGRIERLRELDTDGVTPTYQVTGLQNIWREDAVGPQVPREELLKLAPDSKNNQVRVPKVL